MANITRFIPLEGVEDADMRGMGTFLFDDGTQQILEDKEMADLVKTYQDELPKLEAQMMPDRRVASNEFGQTDPNQVSDFVAMLDAPSAPAERGEHVREMPPIAGAPASAAPSEGMAIPMGGGLPAPPSDAQNAAELHRLAAQRALKGSYVPGQQEGYTPVSRTGALPEDVARQQAAERKTADTELISATEQARAGEAEQLRQTGLHEAMRLTVQREAEQRQLMDAEIKRARLMKERRAVEDSKVQAEFAQGSGFAKAMAIVGSALLGAIGSDAGLRMVENALEKDLRLKMQMRGSRLDMLANELGDEEQTISAAKAKIYDLIVKESAASGKFLQAAGIDNQTPAIIAELKRRAVDNEHQAVQTSLGKTTEGYQQGRAGGYTGPNLGEAAKHYEAAGKLSGEGNIETLTQGMDRTQAADFVARMEGLADAEHALNEIDTNIGAQRDAAGNVTNRAQLGDIKGAGFFGGRTPDEFSSQKGAALSRETRRLIQAQVKANSGAAATDVERAEYGKNLPLVDEKDFVNATTEERRKWHKNYAKAVALYGEDRVRQFLQGYRGTRGRINMGRGQGGGVQPVTQEIELDE